MKRPMRTKDYLFAQDLIFMLREMVNALLCNLATFPYVFYYKFALILCLIIFYTSSSRFYSGKPRTVFKKKVEECECDRSSVANGVVGWSLYIILWSFYTCPATLNLSSSKICCDCKPSSSEHVCA